MVFAPNAVTASRAITRSDSDTTMVVSAAAGLTLTLPAATGTGDFYRVHIQTTVTSNNVIVLVANATDVMAGSARIAQDAGDTSVVFETAAASDTITLNGTSTGGTRGDFIELRDLAAGFWSVHMVATGTGTEATPFSATVS